MRIIAGKARGRTLYAPKGQHTRPTQDYVRESLFNIMQRSVPEAVVLDLFAGTGALGLEALSRGAQSAVLADKSRQAVACIKRNVDSLEFSGQTTVLLGDYKAVLKQLSKNKLQFDLVFIDPPYQLSKYREMTDLLQKSELLTDGALLMIEHSKDAAFTLSPNFTQKDERIYGETVIHLYNYFAGGINDGN